MSTMPLVMGLAVGGAVLLWPRRSAPPWTPGRMRRRPRRGGRGRGHVQPGLVPEALELIALALRGGGSLSAAVTSTGHALPEELGAELMEVGALLGRGDPEQAWAVAGPRWEPARRSLQLAETAGAAPGPALKDAARDLRRDAVAEVEVAAARLGVRLVLPLGLAYLPAFVLTTVLPVVLALTQGLTW